MSATKKTLVIMLALVLSGYILEYTGFDAALGENQTPEAIFRMRWIYAIVPASGFVISAILIAFFPLSARRLNQLRELESSEIAPEEAGNNSLN